MKVKKKVMHMEMGMEPPVKKKKAKRPKKKY